MIACEHSSVVERVRDKNEADGSIPSARTMSKTLDKLLKAEIKRQNETIDLIPSENLIEPDILKLLATPFANKYSEGYPGRRYYPGNTICDLVELFAQKEGLKAFGLDKKGPSTGSGQLSGDNWYLNVQPYSGSPANQAIYFALMQPGDTVLGMKLAAGGHLTHGHKVNFSGTYYKSVQYGLNPKTELMDYDEVERLAREHKPKIIFSGATAYPRIINFKRFSDIAKKVGAYHAADISHIAGLIAAGVHPSPFAYADVVMSTTHKTLRGPRGAVIFSHGEEIAKKIDKAVMPGLQGGPHNNQTAAIALMFEKAQTAKFKNNQKQTIKNAKVLAQELSNYGFKLISGGTDNHLLLVDMRNKNLDGTQAEKLLEASHIIANRNSVPGDSKPFHPSGIRLGTPYITSRGLKEKEMKKIAMFIHHLIDLKEPAESVKKEVIKLCKKFPLPYRNP